MVSITKGDHFPWAWQTAIIPNILRGFNGGMHWHNFSQQWKHLSTQRKQNFFLTNKEKYPCRTSICETTLSVVPEPVIKCFHWSVYVTYALRTCDNRIKTHWKHKRGGRTRTQAKFEVDDYDWAIRFRSIHKGNPLKTSLAWSSSLRINSFINFFGLLPQFK